GQLEEGHLLETLEQVLCLDLGHRYSSSFFGSLWVSFASAGASSVLSLLSSLASASAGASAAASSAGASAAASSAGASGAASAAGAWGGASAAASAGSFSLWAWSRERNFACAGMNIAGGRAISAFSTPAILDSIPSRLSRSERAVAPAASSGAPSM